MKRPFKPWRPSYWDGTTSNAIAKSSQEEIYAAVGQALTSWSFVEHDLCEMFMAMFSDFNGKKFAFDLLSSRESASLKVDIVRLAINSRFNKTGLGFEYADLLLDHLSEALAIRNKIAHGAVTILGESAALFAPPTTKGAKSPYIFDREQLIEYSESFRALSFEIRNASSLIWPQGRRHALHKTKLSQYFEQSIANLPKAPSHQGPARRPPPSPA